MEIMNRENDMDPITEANTVARPIEKVIQKQMIVATQTKKPEKSAGPFKVWAEIIPASGEIEIGVKMELFRSVLKGK